MANQDNDKRIEYKREISEQNSYVRDHKVRYTIESNGVKNVDISLMTGKQQTNNERGEINRRNN